MLSAKCSLPPAYPKVFANSNGAIATPRAVRAEIGRAKIPVARSQAVEKKVLCEAHLETPSYVNCRPPGMLNPNGVEGPGVESFGDILTEEEVRLAENHKTPQRTPAKRASLQHTAEHVTGEGVAWGVGPTEV